MKERKSAELGPLLSFSPQRKQAFLQQKTNARDPWWMDTHTGEGVACALGVCRERHCRCEVSALTLRSCEPSMDTLRPGERDARTHPTLGQRLRAYNFFFFYADLRSPLVAFAATTSTQAVAPLQATPAPVQSATDRRPGCLLMRRGRRPTAAVCPPQSSTRPPRACEGLRSCCNPFSGSSPRSGCRRIPALQRPPAYTPN